MEIVHKSPLRHIINRSISALLLDTGISEALTFQFGRVVDFNKAAVMAQRVVWIMSNSLERCRGSICCIPYAVNAKAALDQGHATARNLEPYQSTGKSSVKCYSSAVQRYIRDPILCDLQVFIRLRRGFSSSVSVIAGVVFS